VRSLQNEAVRILIGPKVSEVRSGLGWWLGVEGRGEEVLYFVVFIRS